jgi:hypothetical protein
VHDAAALSMVGHLARSPLEAGSDHIAKKNSALLGAFPFCALGLLPPRHPEPRQQAPSLPGHNGAALRRPVIRGISPPLRGFRRRAGLVPIIPIIRL